MCWEHDCHCFLDLVVEMTSIGTFERMDYLVIKGQTPERTLLQ